MSYNLRDVFDALPQLNIVDRFDKDLRDLESLNFSDSDSEQEINDVKKKKRKKSESEYSEVIFTEEELKRCERISENGKG